MPVINLIVGDLTYYMRLRKGALRKLRETGAVSVVFGVNRNEKGQLSTFFIPFFKVEDLYDYDARTNQKIPILAVHAGDA